jgi:hypothetical protein
MTLKWPKLRNEGIFMWQQETTVIISYISVAVTMNGGAHTIITFHLEHVKHVINGKINGSG